MSQPIAELKDRLKQALTIRNIKPIELSEATKIPKSAISQYMSGYTKPKQDRIFSICKFLRINEAWLLGYDVPMEQNKIAVNSDNNDTDLTIIQRERSKMSDKEKTKLMNILKANFDDYNWEEDDSGNIE